MRSISTRGLGRRGGRAVLVAALSLHCSRGAPKGLGDDRPGPSAIAASTAPDASASAAPATSASAAPAPSASSCGEAVPACRARIPIGKAGKQLAYYASRPLERADGLPTRAIIVIHGARHSPSGYFEGMTRLAGQHARSDDVAVIAPHFQTGPDDECWDVFDHPEGDELFWSCEGWKMGQASLADPNVSSFEALDALIDSIRRSFPRLARITLAGHSAGAQLVQRYAALRRPEDGAGAAPIRYVVSSPSSYLYLDARRLRADARCDGPSACALDATSFEAPFSGAKSCPRYDTYKYGLSGREGYAAALGARAIQERYAARDVVLLLGELDTGKKPEAAYRELDKTCAAEAQGPRGRSFRLERGLVYQRYVNGLFGAHHALDLVPGCGHDDACLFASPKGVERLFGR